MKQNISVKQLNELSDKGRKAFYKYLKSKGIKVTEWKDSFGGDNYEVEEGMLLSIGQMIEFLGDSYIKSVVIDKDGKRSYTHTTGLADALWESVKEVLN